MICIFRHAHSHIAWENVAQFSGHSIHRLVGVRRYASHTHYDTLSLSRNSSQKEIKARFYELSKKLHPDVAPESAKEFTEINAAYAVLRDAKDRLAYDRTLSANEGSGLSHRRDTQRSASGLSRRRTRPVGTPPSSPYRATPSSPSSSGAGGFGFGSNPSPTGDVRNQHFEYEQHRERHSTFDSRFSARSAEDLSRRNDEMRDNFLARFFGIAGLVLVVIVLTGGISNVRAEADREQAAWEPECCQIDWKEAVQRQRRSVEWNLWRGQGTR